jgi:hypothetical protein
MDTARDGGEKGDNADVLRNGAQIVRPVTLDLSKDPSRMSIHLHSNHSRSPALLTRRTWRPSGAWAD